MKKAISFIRKIHPIFIYPVLMLVTILGYITVFGKIQNGDMIPFIVMGSLFAYIGFFIMINMLTKGKPVEKYEESKTGYISYVTVSYFGERVRWCGYFKTKYASYFAAVYQAWFLDHFGDVNGACGIHYRVKDLSQSSTINK